MPVRTSAWRRRSRTSATGWLLLAERREELVGGREPSERLEGADGRLDDVEPTPPVLLDGIARTNPAAGGQLTVVPVDVADTAATLLTMADRPAKCCLQRFAQQ